MKSVQRGKLVFICFVCFSSCTLYTLASSQTDQKGMDLSFLGLGAFAQVNAEFSLVSVFPEKGSVSVPTNTNILWEFSAPILDGESLETYFQVQAEGLSVTGDFIVRKNYVIFRPETLLSEDREHLAQVLRGLTNNSGIDLLDDIPVTFRTALVLDTIPPTVQSVSPSDGTVGVPVSSIITAIFSEPILPTSWDGNSITLTREGIPLTGNITQVGAQTLIFVPSAPLPPLSTIVVQVQNTIQDLAGNPMDAPFSFSFVTEDLGSVSVYAGSSLGFSGNQVGPSANARFDSPSYLTIDGFGNLYVTDTNNCSLKQITPSGNVIFFAGSNSGLCGFTNANGLSARFNYPQGAVVNPANSQIFLTDKFTHTVRRVNIASPFAVATNNGNNVNANVNGSGTSSRFSFPEGISIDPSGALYVTDTGNCAIRKIVGTTASTLAGPAPSSVGVCGYTNATGTAARFAAPRGLTVDNSGNLYVTDTGNCAIRKITSTGVVSTFAGPSTPGNCGFVDGASSLARFNSPQGITQDPIGNLYVTDTGNCAIRKITPQGEVSTYSGGMPPTPACGNLSSTRLSSRYRNPKGIVRDPIGNLYIADTLNHQIKKIAAE